MVNLSSLIYDHSWSINYTSLDATFTKKEKIIEYILENITTNLSDNKTTNRPRDQLAGKPLIHYFRRITD